MTKEEAWDNYSKDIIIPAQQYYTLRAVFFAGWKFHQMHSVQLGESAYKVNANER